ncbi:hypothetical protein [Sphingomonas kyeonggiensis]|uniref:Small-conductance mechanosensitive channel n=1 Tax=Sphingomonas kyeonggiensis TaxID=1268553 RepID=A0A7W6JZ27_9SPHN|nr:hypothetical protein [Sphingomonas kyeonggiensis]MBB4101057.1 small-conductance mechanosensitive channel [Sphingomonas kyeonggiensis]
MTHRSSIIVGLILIGLATVPDLLVVPVVGPINLLFSIVLSMLYALVAWLLKERAGWFGLALAVPFGIIQFFTPVPYWVCVDAGYRFCPSMAAPALESAIFNVFDAVIIILFIAGYALVQLGMRVGARLARQPGQI